VETKASKLAIASSTGFMEESLEKEISYLTIIPLGIYVFIFHLPFMSAEIETQDGSEKSFDRHYPKKLGSMR